MNKQTIQSRIESNNRLFGSHGVKLVTKSPERIIQNSITLFKEKGFNATSVNDIASASGMLKGSLYNHFKGKEEILKKVIETVEQGFFEYIKINDNKDVDEILKWTADFFLNNECCLLANLLNEKLPEEAKKDVVGFFQRWKDKIVIAMDDRIPLDKRKSFAQDVIVAFEGGIIMKRIEGNNGPIERYLDRLTRLHEQLNLEADANAA